MFALRKCLASTAVFLFAAAGAQSVFADTYLWSFDQVRVSSAFTPIDSVATLEITDILGGAAFTFTGTFDDLGPNARVAFVRFDGPNGAAGEVGGLLPLAGPSYGTWGISGFPGTVKWDVNYGSSGPTVFNTGDSTTWEILGTGVTAASFSSPVALQFQQVTSGDIPGGKAPWVYATLVPVPEPGTFAMLLAGLGMLGFMARRRQRQS